MTTRASFAGAAKPRKKSTKPPHPSAHAKMPKSAKPPMPNLKKKQPKSQKPPVAFTKGDSLPEAQRKMGIAQNRRKRNKGRS